MGALYNLARMTTATTGTGTITLGSAVSGFLTFAGAGVANGDVVSYGIMDGANSEVGTGTYTSAGTTLTRTVTKSTNSNTAISLSGSAQVYVTARAEDLFPVPIGNGGTNNTGAYSTGSVIYSDGSKLLGTATSALFWDGAAQRLGIGTAAPSFSFSCLGTAQFSLTTSGPGCRIQVNGSALQWVGINHDNNAFNEVQFAASGSIGWGLATNNDFYIGSAALATNATAGFPFIPSCAGTPTGTPTTRTGRVALVYDTTNNKLAVYNGAWKQVTLA